jgi:hypothetical protein
MLTLPDPNVLSKDIEQAVSSAIQSVIIILLGWIAGAGYAGGGAGMAVTRCSAGRQFR